MIDYFVKNYIVNDVVAKQMIYQADPILSESTKNVKDIC